MPSCCSTITLRPKTNNWPEQLPSKVRVCVSPFRRLTRESISPVHIYPHKSVGDLSLLQEQMSYSPITIHEPAKDLVLKWYQAHPCVSKKARRAHRCQRARMPTHRAAELLCCTRAASWPQWHAVATRFSASTLSRRAAASSLSC